MTELWDREMVKSKTYRCELMRSFFFFFFNKKTLVSKKAGFVCFCMQGLAHKSYSLFNLASCVGVYLKTFLKIKIDELILYHVVVIYTMLLPFSYETSYFL